jgi:predicted HAD superfamily Cof-like phosphohydrolase
MLNQTDLEAFGYYDMFENQQRPPYSGYTPLKMAKQFAQVMEQVLNRETAAGLIEEEYTEWWNAYASPAEELKELADLVYVIYGYANVRGWNLDEALRRVHVSNMSKLGDDGRPLFRADGKVMKGPNYKKPDLGDLV